MRTSSAAQRHMCVCVCVCVCVYIYIYVLTHIHILIHIHICSCIHRFVDVQLPFVRVRVCVFGACARVMRPLRLREFACCISVTYTADSARTHTLTLSPPHTNTHARTRAHTQTHTCPCTQRCLLFDAVFFLKKMFSAQSSCGRKKRQEQRQGAQRSQRRCVSGRRRRATFGGRHCRF